MCIIHIILFAVQFANLNVNCLHLKLKQFHLFVSYGLLLYYTLCGRTSTYDWWNSDFVGHNISRPTLRNCALAYQNILAVVLAMG